MYITKLVLHRYKRLMLSNVQYFEYSPSKSLQMIIGSNGSGKSSVLSELGPVPSHHSNFVKGGYKVFGCQHHNREYLLRSDYTGGSGKHSFVVRDGETSTEYNSGGTFAIQKELVEEHFGLTQDIFELLIGQTTFTGMTTAKRREWLTKLSPVDLSFAFKTYNEVKSAHRDHLGVVKLSAKRMANENHDLPDDAEIQQYRKRITALTDKISRLMELRQNGVVSPYRNMDELKRHLSDATENARRALTYHVTPPPGVDVRSESELNDLIAREQDDYQNMRGSLDRMVDDHQQLLQNAPSRDEQMSETDIAAIKAQAEQCKAKADTLSQSLAAYQGPIPLVDIPLDHNPEETLKQLFGRWMDLVSEIPENRDRYFSSERGRKVKEIFDQRRSDIRGFENRRDTVLSRLASIKGCETIECPKCDHAFRPGVDPREITQLEQERDQLHARLGEQNALLEKEREYLEAFEHYSSFVRAWRHLVSEYPVFSPVWDYCTEHNVMFVNPRDYTTHITEWYKTMGVYIAKCQNDDALQVLQHRLRYVEAIDRNAVTQHDQRRMQLEQEIEARTRSVNHHEQYLTTLKRYRHEVMEQHTSLLEYTTDLEVLLENVERQTDALFHQAVEQETRHAQTQLAQTHEQLSRIEMREAVLNDLAKEHERAKQAHSDYGLLVKSLAPTDGLIGRYLMNFMHGVVRMINIVIAEVWTYPMVVLPSQVEKEELDYRFPLDVNNGAVTPKDISLGSSSQRDMVNFAFRLLAMKFLRLEDMPLYLDEFGSTFDEQHRENLIPFINQMLEMGQVNQLFYISHFGAVHGAFTSAEFCVLDPTNITTPRDYNQHVVIS